jgi:hypothetical protein
MAWLIRSLAGAGGISDDPRPTGHVCAVGSERAGPPWAVYGSSPAYLALDRGLVYLYLDGNARAVEWLSAGLTEMPPEAGQSELFAGYRVQLATAHARARDPEQACSVAA